MKMRRSAIQLTVVASLWLSASISQAALFTGIFAFGDSLTDSGNTSLATGGAMPGASYYNGRYSNGPVWAEKLAGQLALPGFSASLAGGNDYAWAGAYTQTGGSVPTVTQQAAGFIGAGKTFLATDLIVVWAGANDFLLGGQLDPTIPAGNLAGIISTLAGAGARNFLLPNLPDLGDTPELISTGNAAAILGFSQLSMAFNASLYARIPDLESSLGIDIIPLDIFGIGKDLRNNPPTYGFTNTSQSALLTGNAAAADQYLYWDTVHPTARVHDIFASQAYLALCACPEPGSATVIVVSITGMLLQRRRGPGLRVLRSA